MRIINKDFSLLLSGQAVSQIGDKFHMIAISLWVLNATGSTAKMGAVLAASLIPALLLSPLSGAVVDKYNRKYIIVYTDLLRGLVLSFFAFSFYLDYMNFKLILLMQILLSINSAFFDPAIPSIIPQIVSKEDLKKANSLHQFIDGFSTIAGAFLGGIAISTFGYFSVFAFNSISFLFSAFFEGFINIPINITSNTVNVKSDSLVISIRNGFSYILRDKNLIILLIMVMIIHFFVGSIEVFMPIIASLNEGNEAQNLGYFHTAFAFGTILISSIFSVKKILCNEKHILFSSVFFMGVIYIVCSNLNWTTEISRILFILTLFLFGGSVISAFVSFRTLLQLRIDNQFSGRTFAIAGAISDAALPLSMIIYGFLLERLDISKLFWVSGIFLIILSIISFLIYDKKDSKNEIKE